MDRLALLSGLLYEPCAGDFLMEIPHIIFLIVNHFADIAKVIDGEFLVEKVERKVCIAQPAPPAPHTLRQE